ncbi:dihydropteroate synthase [Clostridium acetobutylicum]|uniref:Dihydropteroate synthase n=1 Tax=Clostridium acetobutylicum (strain ATCC 824 / DSM 792 / JCM 1419 / IAM 19013 / LMG 5710 / NBRC 13948 / NRRL B-527 / VKM B-1787 / 2291 / W) TaxID=272562 RepID=Q97F29_CLOAB|nr:MULTISPECIES: dihydropteroate synthase [Clostridium]AAK80868.1 Dihydropteroate synthase [Clostridium acetobutylicum ATCC 824]ADZ21970.1 Dihydropteroate synthase [Clostridium acetobutylicum EA 2018]AEI33200.1 dihydropteroate synthase [Clostridium acetobutylicum DSM 1731]AWV78720.1 dihydropteroate synthase [Clostridium acetobutylicum]MBC2393583.1 dihydropteroate synthase [Clostridium acetobutylicum]
MKIANKDFILGERTYIMGILNVTPDSFSDGGKFNNLDNALKHAAKLIEDGADIIDIGGESTRPNHSSVDKNEELERVIPIIEAVSHEFDIPISIDTYKGEVAEAALESGAHLINDVWGFKKDTYMAKVAAKYDVPCCLMHNRENNDYSNFLQDVIDDLKESIDIAINAGVKPENIMIDPGIGFAKDFNQNLLLMNNLEKLNVLNFPILLGTSRKSMIGNILNLPPNKRVEGTVATSVIGVVKGCDFIRVHDVLENKRACMVADAIIRR